MGITNTVATIPGIAAPQLTDMIATADPSAAAAEGSAAAGGLTAVELRDELQKQWRLVFFIAAGIYIVGVLVYLCLGSGVKQQWADGKKPDQKANIHSW